MGTAEEPFQIDSTCCFLRVYSQPRVC
jgi:hypothetical protein